ncbi:MAG: ROK family protein [Anaerolineae bacterium]
MPKNTFSENTQQRPWSSRSSSTTGHNHADLSARNRALILHYLLRHGPASRAEIARATELTPAAITRIVQNLFAEGFLQDLPEENPRAAAPPSGPGRPPTLVQLTPDSRWVVGVRLGRGLVEIGMTNVLGGIIARRILPLPRDEPPAGVVQRASRAVLGLAEEHGLDGSRVLGVGVGASGWVDPVKGLNIRAPNLGWSDVPLGDMFAAALGWPVVVESNVRTMALAEKLLGPGEKADTLVFLYLGPGVGAGLIVNDRIMYGHQLLAGGIAHVVVDPQGPECFCGSRGCLEAIASEWALVRRAQRALALGEASSLARQDPATLTAEAIFDAAIARDALALSLVEGTAKAAAAVLAPMIRFMSPEMVFIGGDITRVGAPFMDTLRRSVDRLLGVQEVSHGDRIHASTFGSAIGLVGAAALALDAFLYHAIY